MIWCRMVNAIAMLVKQLIPAILILECRHGGDQVRPGILGIEEGRGG